MLVIDESIFGLDIEILDAGFGEAFMIHRMIHLEASLRLLVIPHLLKLKLVIAATTLTIAVMTMAMI